MSVYNLTVIVTKDEDGNFIARCPSLQGCYADGRTKEEALEVIEGVIMPDTENPFTFVQITSLH